MINDENDGIDIDPLDEIYAIRDALSRRFPTARAFGDYLRK